jgi:hypothetical protein
MIAVSGPVIVTIRDSGIRIRLNSQVVAAGEQARARANRAFPEEPQSQRIMSLSKVTKEET